MPSIARAANQQTGGRFWAEVNGKITVDEVPELAMSHDPSPLHIQRMGVEQQGRLTEFRPNLESLERTDAL
jgi:hypothetical protein